MGVLQSVGRALGGHGWKVADQAAAQAAQKLEYPAVLNLDGTEITLRLFERDDRDAMVTFARAQPVHDLLFLRRDITQPAVVSAWLQDIEEGFNTTVIATHDDAIVGYAGVNSDRMSWTRHVAELRVLVDASMRSKRLGRLLVEQAFAIARERDVKKMVAQMTTDQGGAIRVFTRMGFQREARLRNQVMDRDSVLHDLQIMSLDVDEFQAKIDVMMLSAQSEFMGI
ncbi:MAG: GNAT family N-acetyltransferase [Chloroflexota bacterium]|nr:GNAT family N-acetyltransferase [Chloroflexota bacterium]MDE2697073.1 GNAT family N-acetyltransferase [Chloroflexota bacterium]MXW23923.1 GNAT family N-acetyltransferase [Chloroflexota bacterium]